VKSVSSLIGKKLCIIIIFLSNNSKHWTRHKICFQNSELLEIVVIISN
jgi:hypothetical protein